MAIQVHDVDRAEEPERVDHSARRHQDTFIVPMGDPSDEPPEPRARALGPSTVRDQALTTDVGQYP